MTQQRTALGDMAQALAQPYCKWHDAEQVLAQCNIFLACIAASNGQPLSTIKDGAKMAFETVSDTHWNQIAHELFLCILLDGGYIRINRDMRPELQTEVSQEPSPHAS